MKLILSGGGIGEKTKEAYNLFAQELNGGKVLFIPIADEEKNPQEAFEWFKNEVQPYGITNIDLLLSAQDITPERLASVDGIYFEGGNTFLLLHLLKSCEAFSNIKDVFRRDMVVMGGSAGAMIFGKSIEPCLKDELKIIASDENTVGLKNMLGYNLLNEYSLFVHYRVKERQYEVTEQKLQNLVSSGHNMICLPEETSVFLCDGKLRVLGTLPAEIATKKFRKLVYPGENI